MSPSDVQAVNNDPPPLKRSKMAELSAVTSGHVSMKSSSTNKKTNEPANGNGNNQSNRSNSIPPNDGTFDHNLYSRQLYALGESAMVNLRKSKVLISGIGSVGVEVAKNLILGGVRHVTIQDTKNTQWKDLSAQFYLSEQNLGQNRAQASFYKLEELNDSVQCTLSIEPLTEEFVKNFDLVVLTDSSYDTQLKVNGWTRSHGNRFISADARGLFGYLFVDLGEKYRVDDLDGEQCIEVIIEHVNGETGDVFTLEGAFHGFANGDYVAFSEVRGMTELNTLDPVKIKVIKPNIFNIGEAARNFQLYSEGGRARQVKVPCFKLFKSLKESLKEPDFLIWDFSKFDEPPQLQALWLALYSFEKKYNRSPNVRSIEDANLLKAELPEGNKIPENLINNFSFQATGNLQPVSSIVGGITAQEAMKAVTHHTTPLKQFLYLSCLEALPGDYSSLNASKLTVKDCEPRNNRYDGQAAVFGWQFQEALEQQKWFVVGAGAIGCELLKNMAMIGLACGSHGKLKVTDMDTIEISNLNRQFLFRRKDVGDKKSEVAANAIKGFNKKINIEFLSERVAEDTENVFNDEFFEELNGVANALDNVNARRYMDRRCIYYELPLLESGTMGGLGNTQVIFPHLTESYSSSNDPPEKETPACTLKNFPYEIQHTIQWAKEKFVDLFTSPAESVNEYLLDVRSFLDRLRSMNSGQQIEILKTIKKALIDEKPSTPKDCVFWARTLFQNYFHDEISQLLHTFPSDHVTSQGVKFWSGTKRCPTPLKFDVENEFHLDFVYAGSILRAQQYNLEPITDRVYVAQLANEYKLPNFVPRSGIKIAVTDAEAESQNNHMDANEDSETLIENLNVSLARLKLSTDLRLTTIDFEKDDDANHHVEFITATSNLRASNYEIQTADRVKTKQVAGKIIPALATTTSIVAGLILVELYKIIERNGKRANPPLDKFKNGFLNLALPFFAFSEPIAAPKKKYANTEFTLWDRLEIAGPMTLGQIIKFITDRTGLQVSMMSSGVSLLYAFFQPKAKMDERLKKDAASVVEEVSRKDIPAFRRSLVFEAVTQDDADNDIEIPFIKYRIVRP